MGNYPKLNVILQAIQKYSEMNTRNIYSHRPLSPGNATPTAEWETPWKNKSLPSCPKSAAWSARHDTAHVQSWRGLYVRKAAPLAMSSYASSSCGGAVCPPLHRHPPPQQVAQITQGQPSFEILSGDRPFSSSRVTSFSLNRVCLLLAARKLQLPTPHHRVQYSGDLQECPHQEFATCSLQFVINGQRSLDSASTVMGHVSISEAALATMAIGLVSSFLSSLKRRGRSDFLISVDLSG